MLFKKPDNQQKPVTPEVTGSQSEYSVTRANDRKKGLSNRSLSASLSSLDGSGNARSNAQTSADSPQVEISTETSSSIFRRRIAASWLDGVGVAALAVAITAVLLKTLCPDVPEQDYRYNFLASALAALMDCVSGGALIQLCAVALVTGSLPITQALSTTFAIMGGAIASCVYHVGFESATGSTPGKRMLGLVVNNAKGKPASFTRVLIRHCCRTIGLIAWWIPILPLLLSNEHQLVHDRIAGTFIDDAPPTNAKAGEGLPVVRRFKPAPAIAPDTKCATLKQRVGSSLIDAIVFYLFELTILLLSELAASNLAPIMDMRTPDLLTVLPLAATMAAAMFVPPLLMALFECSPLQATPGKLILGLKISDLKERPINFIRAIDKQFVQFCAYVSMIPVWMAGIFVAANAGAYTFAVTLITLALGILIYGGLICLTFRDGRQSVIDKISRRLVLQNKAPKKLIASFATFAFTAACVITSNYISGQPSILAYQCSMFNPSVTSAHDKLINLSNSTIIAQHFGFIDHKGNLKIEAKYDEAGSFHDKLAPVKLSRRWGFINPDGKVVVPIKYRLVESFSDGYAPVQKKLFWNYIDTQGHELPIKENLIWARPFEKGVGLAGKAVNSRIQIVIVTRKGEIIVPRQKHSGEKINAPILVLNEGDGKLFKQTFVSTDGVIITDQKLDAVQVFSEGKGGFSINGRWGFMDSNGNVVIKPVFDDVGEFRGGVAVAKKNKLYGLINAKGQWVLKPQYKEMMSLNRTKDIDTSPEDIFYSEGVIPIISERRWGFASTKTAKIVIKPAYAEVGCFRDNRALVAKTSDMFWVVPKEEEETTESETEETKSSDNDK